MLTIEINKTNVSRVWRTTTRQCHYPHDKPAYTRWYFTGQKYYESYRLNGKYHRDNCKPAHIRWYDNGQKGYESYHLNGIQYFPRKPKC